MIHSRELTKKYQLRRRKFFGGYTVYVEVQVVYLLKYDMGSILTEPHRIFQKATVADIETLGLDRMITHSE